MLEIFTAAGGLFAMLAFVHFFADWMFQTHREATTKHNNPYVRARHCAIYTVAFLPHILLLGISGWFLFFSVLTLFLSHFIIDTYVPVFLWAKYLRRVPALQNGPEVEIVKGIPQQGQTGNLQILVESAGLSDSIYHS